MEKMDGSDCIKMGMPVYSTATNLRKVDPTYYTFIKFINKLIKYFLSELQVSDIDAFSFLVA